MSASTWILASPPYLRKSYAFPIEMANWIFAAIPPLSTILFKVSRDNPAYFLTSVTHKRLPIFQTDKVKDVVCKSLNEARSSAGLLIFAYVIMPDHMHLLTDSVRSIPDVLRYTNGIIAKRLISYLRENEYLSSLEKLRRQEGDRNHKHSLFEHHPNALRVTSEESLMQKVNYIHLNPVRDGLVKLPAEYRYSSARLWMGRAIDDEPLMPDHKKIWWRPAA